MTKKEREVLDMIDEVCSSTFGINSVHIKKLKERYMKAPFPVEEIKKMVEKHCKDIQERAIERIM